MRKIAVEVKNYAPSGGGVMADFHRSIGQYLMYKTCFKKSEPDREVFKAVPKATYDGSLSHPQAAKFLKEHDIKTFTYNPDSQTLDKWIE